MATIFRSPRWPPDEPEIADSLRQLIDSGDWGSYEAEIHGALEKTLESTFCQGGRVRLCCSGTAAIELAMRAARIGPGDDVVVAAYDYPGNFRTIEIVGAKPVLLDCDFATLSISPETLERVAAPAVRAVIASHLHGQAAKIGELRSLCDEKGWVLIEDVCQSPGLQIDDRPAGSYGHVATLSFGGSKQLTAGNGGALLINDERIGARVDAIIRRPSDAYPLSALQAAAVLPQLSRLAEMNARRHEVAMRLSAELPNIASSWQILPQLATSIKPSYYKYPILAKSPNQRDTAIAAARNVGVPLNEPFRTMGASSDRRCRKPMPLSVAADLSERLMVLNHTALLTNEPDTLLQALAVLHDETDV